MDPRWFQQWICDVSPSRAESYGHNFGSGEEMKEYRCTRNQPYQAVACPGNLNVRARQGYYIRANNEREALEQMRKNFPHDWQGFTVTLWRNEHRQLVN